MPVSKKKITMQSIADELGISKNSVSLALNGKVGVSEELRKKVHELAASMNYQGYQATQAERSKCIVIIVPEYLRNDSFFYHDVFWAIESEAKRLGCIPINAGVSLEMEKNLEMPILPNDMDICGILAVGVIKDAYVTMLYRTGLPMLTVDISYSCVPIGYVGTANINGGFIATQYLIDKGHRDIGFVGSIHDAQSVFERWCGFKQALLKNNLPENDELCILGSSKYFNLLDTIEKLEPCFEMKFDAHKQLPSAWFCAGDRIAIALMNILAKNNVKIPGDVSVMGFDDIPVAEMILPRLTTVRINRKLIGALAVEWLINNNARGVVNINLSGEIVERESVRNIYK